MAEWRYIDNIGTYGYVHRIYEYVGKINRLKLLHALESGSVSIVEHARAQSSALLSCPYPLRDMNAGANSSSLMKLQQYKINERYEYFMYSICKLYVLYYSVTRFV